jgi:hypothetical protein
LTDAEQTDVYVFDHPRGRSGTVHPRLPAVSPLAADRRAITESIFGAGHGVGEHAARIVEDALSSEDITEVREVLGRLGPGFERFQLEHYLRRLEGTDGAA